MKVEDEESAFFFSLLFSTNVTAYSRDNLRGYVYAYLCAKPNEGHRETMRNTEEGMKRSFCCQA